MPLLEIRINEYGSKEKVFPNADEKTTIAEMVSFGILEKGTDSSDLSVSFLLKKPDGTYELAQLSGNLFRSMIAAFHGSELRFLGYNK